PPCASTPSRPCAPPGPRWWRSAREATRSTLPRGRCTRPSGAHRCRSPSTTGSCSRGGPRADAAGRPSGPGAGPPREGGGRPARSPGRGEPAAQFLLGDVLDVGEEDPQVAVGILDDGGAVPVEHVRGRLEE